MRPAATALMGGEGRIDAFELDLKRATHLQRNVDACGAANITVHQVRVEGHACDRRRAVPRSHSCCKNWLAQHAGNFISFETMRNQHRRPW